MISQLEISAQRHRITGEEDLAKTSEIDEGCRNVKNNFQCCADFFGRTRPDTAMREGTCTLQCLLVVFFEWLRPHNIPLNLSREV